MRKIYLTFILVLFPYCSFCQSLQPINPDSIRWLNEMTSEVANVNQPQAYLKQLNGELASICDYEHKSYIKYRPQAIALCRRVLRLVLRENNGYPTEQYLNQIKQLSAYFHHCNDTLMSLTLELEYNRLYYQQHLTLDVVGEISSKETNRLFNLLEHDYVKTYIRLLWLSNYIFGRHGQASRIEAELGVGLFGKNNYTAGLFYWERAKKSKNAFINDANTNWSFVFMRDSVFTPYLEKLGEHDKDYQQQLGYRELLFHSDQSLYARQARQEILPMMEITNHGDIMSALFYRELGIDHLSQNDMNYAIHYFQRSIDDYKHHSENYNDTLLWGNTLYLLGITQERCGSLKEAKKAYEQVAKLLESSQSIEFSRYFALVANARVCISQGERYSMRKVIGGLEAILNGPDDTDFHFDFLPDIGKEYKNKNQVIAMLYTSYFHVKALELENINIDEAIDNAYYAKQYLEKADMTDNYFYYQIQLLLARLQLTEKGRSSSRIGKVPLPKTLLRECVDAYRQGKTIELQDAAMAYNLLAEMAINGGDEEGAFAGYQHAYQIITSYAVHHMFTMTEGNRAKFWEKVKPILTQTLNGCISNAYCMNSLSELALDCSLFMKGLLLQSSNELRHIIYESKDKTLIVQYEQMLQRQESEQLSEYITIHSEELDLLHHPIIASKLSEMQESFVFNGCQLKKMLKKGDVALEFVETNRIYDDHSILTTDQQYGVIIVKPSEKVRYIPLVRGKDLRQINSVNGPQLYKLIWQPLKQDINECRNIYFSATGLLYNLPIEDTANDEGRAMSQIHNLYRMSSLRFLVGNKEKNKDKAAIFAGLTYHLNSFPSSEQNNTIHNSSIFRDFPDMKSMRYAEKEIAELPGTAKEAMFLFRLLQKNHIPTSLNEKEHGTEESFKRISGQHITLLHMGTHGYANTEKLSTTDENIILSHCGLLLSGAGNTIFSDGLSGSNSEDGILTAREICSMDLRGLNMTILSACETGLGKIDSDGVFGLQRGFKKAGANSILMSLWKVDDDATCLLMTEFYKNWIGERKTKHDALELAKQTVRSHKEKGWDDPKYWAAFILLDALD